MWTEGCFKKLWWFVVFCSKKSFIPAIYYEPEKNKISSNKTRTNPIHIKIVSFYECCDHYWYHCRDSLTPCLYSVSWFLCSGQMHQLFLDSFGIGIVLYSFSILPEGKYKAEGGNLLKFLLCLFPFPPVAKSQISKTWLLQHLQFSKLQITKKNCKTKWSDVLLTSLHWSPGLGHCKTYV